MDNDFMINFGAIIKKSRQKQGMTQAELGQKVDRPQSSIARLESGQLGDTHFGFIIDLAKALDMPAENLVAAAFGRDLQQNEKTPLDKSEILQAIKLQLQESDPRTYKLVRDLFSQLTDWIKEVGQVGKF
jgi:transcriptional regulator with XRE-family HTH domain